MTISYWRPGRPLNEAGALLREYQVTAVNEIVDQFNAGRSDVLLDAPVGSGKTFIAAAVMRLIRDAEPGAKTIYLSGNKTLQRQYHRDFPSSLIIEGHSNYCPDISACLAENKGGECPKCGKYTDGVVGHLVGFHGLSWKSAREIAPTNCAYTLAKRKAVRHHDVVTNPWYYGLEAVHVGDFAGRAIAVYDECDILDGVIDTIAGNSVALSTITKYLDLSPWLVIEGDDGEVVPKRKIEEIKTDEWLTILSLAYRSAMRNALTLPNMSPKQEAARTDADHLHNVYTRIAEGGPRVGVDYSLSDRELNVINVNPGEFGAEFLWPTTGYRLFMTGSFGNTDTWAKYMGLRNFGVVTVPHTFPAYLRPVYIESVGRLTGTWKPHLTDVRLLATRIQEVHRGRTLVLVSSAAQAEVLGTLLPHAITHRNGSEERDRALDIYRATENALLITTTWRGLDLKDDECRTIVIAKVPWSPLNDLNTKRRDTFPGWYEADAIGKITQGLGRGVRGPEDWCYHYIFAWLRPDISEGLPAWVKESVKATPA